MIRYVLININSTIQVIVPSQQTKIPAARVLLSTPTSSDQLTVWVYNLKFLQAYKPGVAEAVQQTPLSLS